MSDEFDEIAGPVRRHRSSPNATSTNGRTVVSAARLVSRLYRSADQSLRARLLTCLVKPLSTLGLVAVASGVFTGLLRRGSAEGSPGAIDDVAQPTFRGSTCQYRANFNCSSASDTRAGRRPRA